MRILTLRNPVGRTTSSNGQGWRLLRQQGRLNWRSRSLERNPTRCQPSIWREALNDDEPSFS